MMTRRTLSWSVTLAAVVALVATACSSSSSGSAATSGATTVADDRANDRPVRGRVECRREQRPERPAVDRDPELRSAERRQGPRGAPARSAVRQEGDEAEHRAATASPASSDKTFSDTLAKIGKSAEGRLVRHRPPGRAPAAAARPAAVVFRVKGADPGRFRDVFIAEAGEGAGNSDPRPATSAARTSTSGRRPATTRRRTPTSRVTRSSSSTAPDDAAAGSRPPGDAMTTVGRAAVLGAGRGPRRRRRRLRRLVDRDRSAPSSTGPGVSDRPGAATVAASRSSKKLEATLPTTVGGVTLTTGSINVLQLYTTGNPTTNTADRVLGRSRH